MKARLKTNKNSTSQLLIIVLLTLVVAGFIVLVAIFHGYSAISFSLGGDWLNIEMSQQ